MKVGVLTIGSLYWDPSPVRKKWRHERLFETAERRVRVPIRYGRCSRLRGCTYTMVFSAALEASKFGKAIILPCRTPAARIEDLIGEAKHLWAAEDNSSNSDSTSASWGCVALLSNPSYRIPDNILTRWIAHASLAKLQSASYEQAAVDECGLLRIPWPDSADGSELDFDVLLATATNPTIRDGRYPSVQRIADAWVEASDKKYFVKNREHRITTFQDQQIENRLKQRGYS